MDSQRPSSRRFRAVLLGLGLGLVAFEAVLQALSLLLWWIGSMPAVIAASTQRVVLCVGDSFTFGIGADSAATCYPAQLERELHAAGRSDITVVNGGWPGQTSGLVLRRLGAQLGRYRPALVYVLVGYNDRWDQASEVLASDTGGGEGFRLICRTARLGALVLAWLRGGGGPPPFLGEWCDPIDGESLMFLADGRAFDDEEVVTWVADGPSTMTMTWPSKPPLLVDWSVTDGKLVLVAGPVRRVLEPGPLPLAWQSLREGRKALAKGDWTSATAALAACVDDPVLGIEARGVLAQALAHSDPEAAQGQVDWLARRYEAAPAAATVHALAGALHALGRDAEVVALACQHLERTGRGRGLWDALRLAAPTPEQAQRLDRALHAAATAGPAAPVLERAELWRALAAARARDAREAARCLLTATALDGVPAGLAPCLASADLTPEVRESLIAEVTADESVRTRLRAQVAAALGASGGGDTLLLRHLRRIVALCRAHAAVPVLLDYPLEVAEARSALRQVERELGAATLLVRPEFERARREHPEVELLDGPEGHCNDAGYGLLARLVAADALPRLVR